MVSKIMSRRPLLISTLVFLDLETTGLPSASFKPEITELCMLAVSRFAVEESQRSLPRVQNKLSLCFRPIHTGSAIASKVSGLNGQNLFHQKDFDQTASELICHFVKRLDPPVCLLAHNGKRFDFPLLQAQMKILNGTTFRLLDCDNSPVVCADTLHMFTSLKSKLTALSCSLDDSGLELDPGKNSPSQSSAPSTQSPDSPVSFRLGDVFSRVFGSNHKHAHSAEGDCKAMLRLVQFLGFSGLDWLQVNYNDFNSIPPMYVSSDGKVVERKLGAFPYRVSSSSTCLDDTVQRLNDVTVD